MSVKNSSVYSLKELGRGILTGARDGVPDQRRVHFVLFFQR